MSNALALPSQNNYESAENRLAQLLLHATSGGKSAKLAIAQSTTGEWSLSASNELRADELNAALRDALSLDIFHVPSDEDEVEEAVVKLKAATNRPVWMDSEDAVAYESALIEACQEYPIDVVQSACKAWRQIPNHGKWWPTEQDLRQQCEALFKPRDTLFKEAKRLLHSLREREKPGQERQSEQRRSISPYGRTKEFVDRVRQDTRLGQNFVRSYLSDQTCDFTDNTIFVAYSTQAERIPQRCSWLMREFSDIKIIHDRQTTERCNRDQDAMGNTWKPPETKRRRD